MKSKATLKVVQRAMKKAKIDMKRAKARGDTPMYLHHQSHYVALGNKG
jgi:hypothetical protein